MIKVKKIALLAVLIVISGPLGAMTTTGRQLAQKYPNLSQSALAALRSGNPQVSRQALARTGYLKQPARYRSTYSMPENQVHKEAFKNSFNGSMKEEFAQKYGPHVLGLGAVAGGAGTYAGLSLYDEYNNNLKRDSIRPVDRDQYFEENPDIFFENNVAKKFIRCDNCPFAGKDFSNKVIAQGMILRKTDLSHANFENVVIGRGYHGADFIDCSLENTNFKHAKLKHVSFMNSVNLKNSNFEHAELDNTHFSTSIENVRFNKAKFNHGSNISSRDVVNSSFVETEFNDAKIIMAHFVNGSFNRAVFDQATFNSSSFKDVLMEHTKFKKVQMWRTTFSKSNLSHADFEYSKFEETDFSQANLQRARFYDCNASDTNFEGADLSGALIEHFTHFERSNFKNADLKNATFKLVNLSGADFTGADITGATFSGCYLQGTKLDTSKLNYEDWLSYKYQNGIFT